MDIDPSLEVLYIHIDHIYFYFICLEYLSCVLFSFFLDMCPEALVPFLPNSTSMFHGCPTFAQDGVGLEGRRESGEGGQRRVKKQGWRGPRSAPRYFSGEKFIAPPVDELVDHYWASRYQTALTKRARRLFFFIEARASPTFYDCLYVSGSRIWTKIISWFSSEDFFEDQQTWTLDPTEGKLLEVVHLTAFIISRSLSTACCGVNFLLLE